MSKATLGQVVKRAISDAAFRRQLQSDPEGALKGFDLTSDERAALRSGDASKLSTFGIDQRMSKAFTSGEVAAASRRAFGSETSDSAAARAAFIDQDAPQGRTLVDDAGGPGRSPFGDQHDGQRAAIGDSPSGGREGSANITSDEAGSDLVKGGSLGPEQHLVVSSDGRDPYLSARDAGTGEFVRDIGTGEPFATAAAPPLGPEQHAVVSSDGRDPYLSARDSGTGEFVRDIGTGEPLGAGAQSSLDVSGQTRDASVIDAGSAGRQTDAFLTTDEMGNNVSASGGSHPSLSADQRLAGETLPADSAADAATDPWLENPEHHA